MNKNEYRRAFIMLRASLPGYAGHVRLEQRTLMGSMYFTATPTDDAGELQAVLAGQNGGQYYAAALGTLRRDRRGQASLAYSFDPRDIAGRPLDSYRWVVVARTGSDGCAIALTGNVDGSYPMDQIALRDAVCALFAQAAPADDLPTRSEAALIEQADIALPPETPLAAPIDAAAEVDSAVPETIIDIVESPIATSVENTSIQPTSEPDMQRSGARILTTMPTTSTPVSDVQPVESETPADASVTAAQKLGIDAAQPWSGVLEPLRELFRRQRAVELPLDGDFVYVRAPMPEGCGYAACLIGLRAEDGRVVAVRYALPDRYAVEAPAGLEDCQWFGGTGDGFWVLTADPDTGAPMNALDYAL